MSNPTCFVPVKGLDDRLAKTSTFSEFNTHQLAVLRGLYVDKHAGHTVEEEFLTDGKTISDLTDEEIEIIADDLLDMQDSLKEEERRALTQAMFNPISSFNQLKEAFTPQQRVDRVNMIADMFTDAIDDILYSNDSVSRDEVIKGFIDTDGKYQYGVGYIFSEIITKKIREYKRIAEINAQDPNGFKGVTQEEWEHRAGQWDSTLRNLGALIVMANRAIRESEGYNIAARLQYAVPATAEDIETSKMSFDFDPEQEVKESWQEHKDSMNPFAGVSKSVRRLLGSLREFTSDSEQYRDDLGNSRKQRPSKVHQDLMTLFRGIQTEQEIITRLEECNQKQFPYAQDLINRFSEDPILRTQFFADFSKVAQLYGMVSDRGDKHVAILNRVSRTNAFKKYLANIKLQRFAQTASSIFTYDKTNKTASVNKDNVQALSQFIVDNVQKKYYKGYGKNTEITKEEYDEIKNGTNLVAKQNLREETNLDELVYQSQKSQDYQSLIDIYDTVFSALGIEVSPFTYMAIAQDKNVARKLNTAIANLTEGLGKLQNAQDYIKGISKTITRNGNTEMDAMGEAISKIYGAMDTFEGNKVINRARFQDKDYFTDVQSSYLGRLRDTLKNILNRRGNKSNEVKKWLIQEYGDNPFFYDKSTGKFRVRWMQDLATNPNSNKSFANSFDYARLLGDNRQNFEDFGNRTQTISNLAGYFNAPGSDYGWYPSFILGDSGVQKMLFAPKYNEKDIIDSFVEAAFQDIELYKQLLAQKQALEKAFEPYYESLKKPDNISEEEFKEQTKKNFMGSFATITVDRENIFALLPFLNDYDLDIDSPNIIDDLRANIADHLRNAFDEYKVNLTADGVFAKNPYNANQYQDSIVESLSKSTKKLIRNPNGYNSIYSPSESEGITTELDANLWQYFLNHRMAMMNQIQLTTVSPAFYKGGLDGNSTDFQKRFKEVHATGTRLSADAINPNTGEKYSENFSQRVVYFSDPKTDSAETNSEFYEALQAFDAENGTNLAEKYRKSDATDGQSIRTLDSYMQIMGMSGRMTPELLNIWDDINDIRADIKDNQRELTDDERNRYDELNKKFSQEPLTAEEHEELAQLKEIENGITREQVEQLEGLMVALQPIKSFIYTWEQIPNADGSVTQIPVQIKHSECVVIPELLPKNSKMRHMMEWAEDNNVQMLTSDTCAKVGNFGGAEIHSATNREELRASLDGGFVHELSYDGYVIQQNNPEHVRESRLIGTQGRKVSFSDLQATDAQGNNIDYSNYLEDEAFVDGEASFMLGERVNQKDYSAGYESARQSAKVTHPNAHQINQLYVGLALANILEDFETFSDKISNPNKVRNILVQMTMNADRTNMENILGLEEQRDAEGKVIHDFIVPLFEGGVEYDNAALLLSMFKNQVNKQKMMGGSAIQASAFGLNGMEESDNLKFRKDPNNDKNILYAEAEIPWDLSYTDATGQEVALEWNDWLETDGRPKLSDEIVTKDDPRYSKYMSFTDENGVVHIPLIEQRFPGILDLVATRIPTEAKYSMLPCKVVRFTHKVAGGGVIRLPLQGVTVAGFDFDIDKLYLQRREFKYTGKLSPEQLQDYWNQYYDEHVDLYMKLSLARQEAKIEGEDKTRLYKYGEEEGRYIKQDFSRWLTAKGLNTTLEKYDYNKSPWDKSQSRVGRNNLLFNLIYSRLQDPNSMQERFTPGGFDTVKAASRDMREIMGIEDGAYDYADPYTLVVYNQQNQVAGKLIGIFANQNANAAMASLMSKLELKTPIAFGNHATAGLTNLLNPNALTKELLAASVDAVKDPCLSMLNFNTITATSAAMLSRLGYSFRDIGLLFNQPAIKNLTKECLDNGINDVVTQIDLAIEHLNADKLVDLSDPTINSGLTSDILEDSLRRLSKESKLDNISDNDKRNQIKALSLFKQIIQSANELNQFVTSTKFTASNSVKSTLGEMYAQQIKVQKYIETVGGDDSLLDIKLSDFTQQESPINDNLDITDREAYAMEVINNPFGYEQVMYDANKAALKQIGKFFPYESMEGLRNKLANACIGITNGDTINAFHKAVIKHILSRDETSPFNENRVKRLPNCVEINAKEYYTRYVPYRIQETLNKYPELKNNPLFALATNDIDSDNNVIFKLADSGALSPTDKENVTNGWEQLMDLGLEDLAEDLYLYNYYMDGFGFGVVGFNHLAPVSVKKSIGEGTNSYLERLWRMMSYNNESMSRHVSYGDMMTQFIKDNPNNYQLVYTPSKEIVKKLYDSKVTRTPLRLDSEVSSFFLDPTNPETKVFRLKETKETVYWKPAIKVTLSNGKDLLYIARPTDPNEINNNHGFKEMEYVLAKDSNGNPIDASKISAYTTDALAEGTQAKHLTPANPKVIDFGETVNTNTLSGFKAFAQNMSNILSQRFSELGTSQELYNEIINAFEEDIRQEQSTSSAMATLKQVIKLRCEEHGYKGAVDGEVIC